MGEKCDWPCWKIMNCDSSHECPAKSRPETPCWELANEVGDYRNFCSICQDCIVYVLKTNLSVLSSKQKKIIMHKKVDCVLAA